MPVSKSAKSGVVDCHSRMPFVRAYRRERQEMLFDVHNRAFAQFGGSCERGIYDNLKTAVDAIGKGHERKLNQRFLQMCSHHLVKLVVCTPAAGWEKGRVEKKIQDLRQVLFTPQRSFEHLEECNQWLLDQCIHYAKTHAHPEFTQRMMYEVFECEQPTVFVMLQLCLRCTLTHQRIETAQLSQFFTPMQLAQQGTRRVVLKHDAGDQGIEHRFYWKIIASVAAPGFQCSDHIRAGQGVKNQFQALQIR